MKKTIFTLDIDNYEPDIFALTLPLMKIHAHKIKADICIIESKVIKGPHPGFEKFQIFKLGAEMGNDWNIFFDSDTLIHPDYFDVTEVIPKDITVSHGTDFVPIRFRPDSYFKRDGRYIGKGNWCAYVSDWCLDYFHPLEDMTYEEATQNVFPTIAELEAGITANHLAEDYIISRNIARYGLKHVLVKDVAAKYGQDFAYCRNLTTTGQYVNGGPLFHQYIFSTEQKVVLMKQQLRAWGLQSEPVTVPDNVPSTTTADEASALLVMDNGNSATFTKSDVQAIVTEADK